MTRAFILWLLLASPLWAEVGKVVKVVGAKDAFLVRNKERIRIGQDFALEVGDHLASANSHLVILIYPASQMSLPKKSQLKITKAVVENNDNGSVKASSTVALLKGLVRVHVTKKPDQQIEQNVVSKNVAFGVRGTEFEVALDDEGVDLDVLSGSVNVSSLASDFLPELVKANQGFRFSGKLKNLVKKSFSPKFNDHPGFLDQSQLKDWMKGKFGDKFKLKDELQKKIDVKEKLKGFFQ